jgi:hypothetical protein
MNTAEIMTSRHVSKAPGQKDRILTSADTVRTTDEVVRTTDEIVRTMDDAIERVTVTEAEAVVALVRVFGVNVDTDYLLGKTRFRDALAELFQLSVLEAEELCEALERSGRIWFRSDIEGSGWHIHAEPEIAFSGRTP